MRTAVALALLSALVMTGCRRQTRENDPMVEVNKVRPKKLVEATNEVGVPLTNVPHVTTETKK